MAGLRRSLLGMGNPLLDITANVDAAFLEKYEVKLADQILAEEKHLPMYEELANMSDVQYVAGGATQNSIRVAQWMLQVPGATSFMGCIGEDDYGKQLRDTATKAGVNVQYMVDPNAATGTCGACILGGERSLITNLAAANNYKVEHLQEKDNFALVEDARIVYMAGYFMTVCVPAMKMVAQHICDTDKIFCTNLSAPFLMQVPPFKAALMELLPFVDYLFGNETEAETFAESEGWETRDIEEIAKKISSLPKQNGCRGRTVVITQGKDPVIVAQSGKVSLYPVKLVPKEKLVDTNGAGDSFVGGFLSQLLVGRSMGDCCRAGNYAAGVVVQQSGCTFPEYPSFVWN